MQVAQELAIEGSEVVVGRLDCTRFTSAATHFPVRGFPTILYIHKDFMIEYDGDRSKEDILDFSRRLSGPAIRPVKDCKQVDVLLEEHKVFFLHVGHPIPDHFAKTANKYRSVTWFYHLSMACEGVDVDIGSSFVVKGTAEKKMISRFDEMSLLESNTSMNQWVRKERFPHFFKVTGGNFNHVIRSG